MRGSKIYETTIRRLSVSARSRICSFGYQGTLFSYVHPNNQKFFVLARKFTRGPDKIGIKVDIDRFRRRCMLQIAGRNPIAVLSRKYRIRGSGAIGLETFVVFD